jgi:hypothetical protein
MDHSAAIVAKEPHRNLEKLSLEEQTAAQGIANSNE